MVTDGLASNELALQPEAVLQGEAVLPGHLVRVEDAGHSGGPVHSAYYRNYSGEGAGRGRAHCREGVALCNVEMGLVFLE